MLPIGLKMFLTVILKGPQVSNVNIKGEVNKDKKRKRGD